MIWDLHCHLNGVPGRTPDEQMARLIECADRMQIERLILFMGSPFLLDPTPEQFRQQNDQVLQAISHWHHRAFGFVYLNPNHEAESLAELDRCVLDGPMVGIKLWVARRCNTEKLDAILRRAVELKAVVSPNMTVDVNVSLSHWPCRRLPLDQTSKLVNYLAMKGVTQAWAGTFEAILHNDLASANQRLADECHSAGEKILMPIGAIHVGLPRWEEDLKRCHEIHGMRGIRLLPGYHGYALDDERLRQLLELVDDYRMLVQIAVRLEDPRTQH